MANTCKLCSHPERAKIDRMIASGRETLREIAGQTGISSSAIHRHRDHVLEQVQRSVQRRAEKDEDKVLSVWEQRLDLAWTESIQGVDRAKANDSLEQGARYLTVAVNAVKLGLLTEGKLSGEAKSTVFNVEQVVILPVAPAAPTRTIEVHGTPVVHDDAKLLILNEE